MRSMKTVMRTLIVWLLLLALPFQGLAAARMLPSAGAPAAQSETHAAPVATPCHDMAAAGAVDDDHRHGQHKQDKEQKQHRSVCGDCCIVVALVPVPLVPPVCAPPSFAIPFRAGHLASADPSLLERPPRHLAA
jgi:hypothetical protein